MVDKQILALKEKLNKLAEKKTTKKKGKTKSKITPNAEKKDSDEVLEKKQAETPEKEEYVDLTPKDLEKLKKQLKELEERQDLKDLEAKEKELEEVPQETQGSEISDEERLRQLQLEIERLQNAGIFRAEVLFQLVNINASLQRIANALDKGK